jgi:hypothetical protein
MPDYVKMRTIKEREELVERLDILNTFVNSEEFKTLDADERYLLGYQCMLMRELHSVLNKRITKFV